MNTLTDTMPQQYCDILLDRETIQDKSKGILIVTGGQSTRYDAPNDTIEMFTQELTTPKSFDYNSKGLSDITPFIEILRVVFTSGIAAKQIAIVNDLVIRTANKTLCFCNGTFGDFLLSPKIIVEVKELSDLAEDILCKTFEIHRL